MKKKLFNKIKAFNDDESGVSAIEYAVILSLISGALLISLPPIGTGLAGTVDVVDTALVGVQSPAQSSAQAADSVQVSGNCPKSGGSGSSGSTWGGWR